MNNIYKEAGGRIYLMRIMRGYTRENLAELANVSAKFLYEIETGKKGFSAVVLYNLCTALKVDCDYILMGQEKPDNDKKMMEILQLFNQTQTEQLRIIIEKIYDLL